MRTKNLTRLVTGVALSLVAVSLVGVGPAVALATRSSTARFVSPTALGRHPSVRAAVSFDPALVPLGARVEVVEALNKWGGMSVTLRTWGLKGATHYDAQVHVGRCSADPASSGARYENVPVKVGYQNDEVWLNFTTSRAGTGAVTTVEYWGVGANQHAASIALQAPGSTRNIGCVGFAFARLGEW
ncbi:MAG: hypothetical protein KGI65_01845 [Acidobacteriota bacterium]|nr:hypothetical protein [Acidobacteriota bacterium]